MSTRRTESMHHATNKWERQPVQVRSQKMLPRGTMINNIYASTPATAVTMKINERRLRLGITQIELSRRSGISRSTLIRRLKHDGLITIPELSALSKVLEMNPSSFLTRVAC